jgi:hypothetical protein
MGQKTLPTKWGTYMKLVTKYQISAINIYIWSQASYRYAILWVAFLDPSDSYFLFANFVDFYTHNGGVHVYRILIFFKYSQNDR